MFERTHPSLLINLELGRPNAGLLRVVADLVADLMADLVADLEADLEADLAFDLAADPAADLAAPFKSRVMGRLACQPILLGYGDGDVDSRDLLLRADCCTVLSH